MRGSLHVVTAAVKFMAKNRSSPGDPLAFSGPANRLLGKLRTTGTERKSHSRISVKFRSRTPPKNRSFGGASPPFIAVSQPPVTRHSRSTTR